MKCKYILLLSLALGFISQPITYTQVTTTETYVPSKYVRIFLDNGGIYEGRVIEITETDFLIETPLMGKMRISKLDISTLVYIDKNQVGELTERENNRATDINPQSTRYFFSPSAYQLKKGEGYYNNVFVLYNQVSYGITDYLTAGVTMTPFGTGGTVKIGGALNDNLSVSAGALVLQPFGNSDFGIGTTGIVFANATFGTERKNISINYGYGFYNESTGENSQLSESINIINVSAMFELGTRAWLMIENYVLFDEFESNTLMLVGIRKATGGRGILWDWGIWSQTFTNDAPSFPAPWVGITIPF